MLSDGLEGRGSPRSVTLSSPQSRQQHAAEVADFKIVGARPSDMAVSQNLRDLTRGRSFGGGQAEPGANSKELEHAGLLGEILVVRVLGFELDRMRLTGVEKRKSADGASTSTYVRNRKRGARKSEAARD